MYVSVIDFSEFGRTPAAATHTNCLVDTNFIFYTM